ncbi:unnamed protein product [Heligmosomoides polygyrus]|uniref:Uncharacterized protein n=1 Tax=Heligmosomoides polygyrus TaxID=6339 RepID=A0A183FJ56_HELPZ|nr:unnamed protein product [Heligmosomoides polygyrus]
MKGTSSTVPDMPLRPTSTSGAKDEKRRKRAPESAVFRSPRAASEASREHGQGSDKDSSKVTEKEGEADIQTQLGLQAAACTDRRCLFAEFLACAGPAGRRFGSAKRRLADGGRRRRLARWKCARETVDDETMAARKRERPGGPVAGPGNFFPQPHLLANVAKTSRQKLEELGWDVLPQPSYSPNLAPSGNHTFRALKQNLREERFDNQVQMDCELRQYFESQPSSFWKKGILDLPIGWEKVVDVNGHNF